MDVQTAKSAIVNELAQRLTVSGGVEVFRRLIGEHHLEVVERALRELVAEGRLKETPLRVGTIYHYPPNVKSSLRLMWEELEKGAAPKPARAAPAAPAAPPAAPTPVEATPAAPAAPPAAPTPVEATPAAAPPTGPVKPKKRSEMTPEELAAEEARRAAVRAARAGGQLPTAPAPPSAAPAPAPTPAAAAAPVVAPTGPIKPKKRSEMTPEELAAEEARRAETRRRLGLE
ncbi:MAG: hypothetical protein HY320_13980 [Armatimonadetes bacterium]|nr:hypothetical protein [Armatimonadota bacterium]